MRGGTKGGFNGDIILKVEVDREDFRNNYGYNHKNRYNNYVPLSELKYSPYSGKLVLQEFEYCLFLIKILQSKKERTKYHLFIIFDYNYAPLFLNGSG